MHTVLIADDDMISLEVLKAMLSAYPLTIITASNGQEAISQAQQEQPDLLILDYDMPEFTGAQVCQQLRSQDEFASAPIIALTGHQSATELTACRDAGMNATLHKPVSPDALASVLRDHLAI